MKTKATLIPAIALAIAAVGTTAYILSQGDAGTGDLGNPSGQSKDQANPVDQTHQKTRPRRPEFESIEEAEQALLDFDMAFVRERDPEEAKRGVYRLRSLVARMPQAYYSELAARFGQTAGSNLGQYFRQMAIYQEWGRVNIKAALADLSEIQDVKQHSKALHNVFVGAVDSDPQAAMTMAETLEMEMPGKFGDFERTDLMDSIFDTWIESDPFSALEWAKQASVSDKRRDQWINDGLRTWTKKDPDAAAKWRE